MNARKLGALTASPIGMSCMGLTPAEFAALEDALAWIPVRGHRGFVERQGGSMKNWGKK